MEGGVYGMVASVGDPGVELLVVLLNLGDEVTVGGSMVVVVVVGVLVVVVAEAVALKVSSSVICDLLKRK